MARITLVFAATMTLAAACLLAGGAYSPAFAVTAPRSPQVHRHGAHRAACAGARGRRASYHAGSRPGSRRRRHEAHCPQHNGKTHHGAPSFHSTTHAPGHSPGVGMPPLLPLAGNGSCADATASPSDANIQLIRAATLCLVNRERVNAGERPLRWSSALISSAQQHTESMAYDGYFEHFGPGGESPLARMRSTGYISSSRDGYEVGENIAWGSMQGGTPARVVAAWMASAGHRANILNAAFRETGIGVSPHLPASLSGGQPGDMYTQDFGVIIPG